MINIRDNIDLSYEISNIFFYLQFIIKYRKKNYITHT